MGLQTGADCTRVTAGGGFGEFAQRGPRRADWRSSKTGWPRGGRQPRSYGLPGRPRQPSGATGARAGPQTPATGDPLPVARRSYDVSGRASFQLACYPGGGARYVSCHLWVGLGALVAGMGPRTSLELGSFRAAASNSGRAARPSKFGPCAADTRSWQRQPPGPCPPCHPPVACAPLPLLALCVAQVRHADASGSSPGRCITALLYLNPSDWNPQVGLAA
jgi:hypothetical protein